MKTRAWVRAVLWCNRHDIPWASCSDLGLSTDECEMGERWVKDEELTSKIGEPDQAASDRGR